MSAEDITHANEPLSETQEVQSGTLDAHEVVEASNPHSHRAQQITSGRQHRITISFASLRALMRFGSRSTQPPPAPLTEILDRIYSDLKGQPKGSSTYAESLRLLQDFSYYARAVPTAFTLKDVTFNRGDLVGRGGEAIIYRGQLAERPVAVREIPVPSKYWDGPEGHQVTQLVHREAITHSQLSHPNILPLLGIYQESQKSPPILVLPLVERGSLRDLLKGQLIDATSFQCILLGISRGVQYLHSRHPPIIHGDLHPGNILIDDLNNPFLCDFGLSRIRHDITRTHTFLQEGGNFRFLAPEFTSSTDESFRPNGEGDVFSLSMIFFNTWTGEVPFSHLKEKGKVSSEFRHNKRPERPKAVVKLPSDVEEGFWNLLLEMWSQQPSDRPSINEVVKRLEQLFRPIGQAVATHGTVHQALSLHNQADQSRAPSRQEVLKYPSAFFRPNEADDPKLRYQPIPTSLTNPGVLNVDLHVVCHLIANYRSIQSGTIRSIETYRRKEGIWTHRFAILELERATRESICLKLELKNDSYISKVDTFGTAHRNLQKSRIKVSMAVKREALLLSDRRTQRETRQLFSAHPSLQALGRLLELLDRYIPEYFTCRVRPFAFAR
ncbi:kinase-like protein [Clavulina sp. PMI_390]|nr:kinase-like protein [Clavulina sp. PMI_390]